MTYFNECTNPKKADVYKIVFRPKGLILCTADYDCFLFKDNKKAKELYELIELFKKSPETHFGLIINPNKKKKLGFDIEVGEPMIWYIYDDFMLDTPDDEESEETLIKQVTSLLPHFPTSEKKSRITNTKGKS